MWNINNHAQFYNCIHDLIQTPSVHAMSGISQHVNVNCLEHSIFVSYISFLICRFFGLDYVAASRGGLLHDLFLYDRRQEGSHKGCHLFSHPAAALENASLLFVLTDMEKDIIVKHMWPLTTKAPKYKESFLVSCADKFCALVEMLFIYKLMNIDRKLAISG
ncbi:MAG: hypothetical protein BWY15_02450 [Firmicutes bacterium ADurb.Bin193]|nr:MAG: hypothetical protein BWY15_02450 [Firmicutes bacterium ADurb.Bin193]